MTAARPVPVQASLQSTAATLRPTTDYRHPGSSAPSEPRAIQSSRDAAGRQREADNIAAGRLPDIHRLLPVSAEDAWEASAVDITRLNKTDPADRARINNAWRALKDEAGTDAAAEIGALFQALRAHFPDAGIEVPAQTLEQGGGVSDEGAMRNPGRLDSGGRHA